MPNGRINRITGIETHSRKYTLRPMLEALRNAP